MLIENNENCIKVNKFKCSLSVTFKEFSIIFGVSSDRQTSLT